jgi:uncharacterized protein (DUF488 family)
VLTIGHSNRTLDALVDLLRIHAVEHVADVRRFPRSRRHPQFSAERLSEALPAAGIAYSHHEPLGGYREPRPDTPHLGLEEPMLRGYADHMETPEFRAALDALLARAATHRVAVMCAEADPARCHRSLLADAIHAHGVGIEHILDASPPRPHVPTPGVGRLGDRLIYRGAVQRLPGL